MTPVPSPLTTRYEGLVRAVFPQGGGPFPFDTPIRVASWTDLTPLFKEGSREGLTALLQGTRGLRHANPETLQIGSRWVGWVDRLPQDCPIPSAIIAALLVYSLRGSPSASEGEALVMTLSALDSTAHDYFRRSETILLEWQLLECRLILENQPVPKEKKRGPTEGPINEWIGLLAEESGSRSLSRLRASSILWQNPGLSVLRQAREIRLERGILPPKVVARIREIERALDESVTDSLSDWRDLEKFRDFIVTLVVNLSRRLGEAEICSSTTLSPEDLIEIARQLAWDIRDLRRFYQEKGEVAHSLANVLCRYSIGGLIQLQKETERRLFRWVGSAGLAKGMILHSASAPFLRKSIDRLIRQLQETYKAALDILGDIPWADEVAQEKARRHYSKNRATEIARLSATAYRRVYDDVMKELRGLSISPGTLREIVEGENPIETARRQRRTSS